MESLKQFFQKLNDVSFRYVVLRNWDGLPHTVELGQHSDLDLLVYDLDHFKEVIPDAKPEFPLPRVRHKLPIGDTFIFMDLRYVGDGYYPTDFENAILATREYNKSGFFTPNPLHHRISLAYHAVHHKGHISSDYRRWLGTSTVNDLFQSLKQSNVGWEKPQDHTVGSFNAYWKGATSVISNDGEVVRKRQINYLRYELLKNEYDILTYLSNKHFPKAYTLTKDTLTIEHCGEQLTHNNLPNDWKIQLVEILDQLQGHMVQHRDIRPDNLMVKNGVIKLIDFGWAKIEGRNGAISTAPPACLGYGYKPNSGFDDKFSMRKVIKELEYKLEEECVS